MQMCNRETRICVHVDFQKANDIVLYEALFAKLEAAAMTGAVLEFITAFYNRSHVQVKIRDDPTHSDIEGSQARVPGVLVFVQCNHYDILANRVMMGVDVPGLLERIKGLMFAKNLVLLGNCPADLQTSLL
mgnify:CR=1 FL=1